MQWLFLFTLFFTAASAFSHAGSFERMYVYYAMKIDAALHGGTPKYIAAGCGQDCTFNAYINYIQGRSSIRITTQSSPPVVSTASALTQEGYNNRINVNKALPDGPGDYGQTLIAIANHLERWTDDIRRSASLQADVKDALNALSYAKEAREIVFNEFIMEDMEKKGWPVSARRVNWPGYEDPPYVVSKSRTLEKNKPKNAKAIEKIFEKNSRLDSSHRRMISAINTCIGILNDILGACTRRRSIPGSGVVAVENGCGNFTASAFTA